MNKNLLLAEALEFGWNTFRANIVFFLGILLIMGLIQGFSNVVIGLTRKDAASLSFFVWIIFTLVNMVLGIGYINICLKFTSNKKCEIEDIFSGVPYFLKYFVSTALYLLIVAGGLVLLIVPGIMWALRYQFYACAVIDKNAGPIEALKISEQITFGYKRHLFVFILMLSSLYFFFSMFSMFFMRLFSVLGILLMIATYFITVPISSLAFTYLYKALVNNTKQS